MINIFTAATNFNVKKKNRTPTGLKNNCNPPKFAVNGNKSIVLSRTRNIITVLGNSRGINIQRVRPGLRWSFGCFFFSWK